MLFRSTVSAKSNLALIEFLRERLAEHGVELVGLSVADLMM